MPSLYFDLPARARLSLNYFTRHFDPRTGFDYMWTYLLTDPPKLSHQAWDLVEESGRALEGLVAIRLMTGSTRGLAREVWLRDKLADLFDRRDRLIYRPQTSYSVRVADVYDQSSSLLGLVMRYLADGDAACRDLIERIIDRVIELAGWSGGEFARFGCVAVMDGKPLASYGGLVTESDNPQEVDEVWMGRFIMPMVMYAKAAGRERPLAFARALARDIALRSGRYGEDGSFSRARHGEDSLWSNGHFHSRSHTLCGILRAAHATGDDELAARAETVFRWALAQGTGFGWFPEFVGRRNVRAEGCETCGVVDMLDAAIQLARAGKTEYWDAADRIWRNQLLEAQLRDVSWVKATKTLDDNEIDTFDRAAERAVGGFAGWSGVNDLISNYEDPYFSSLDRAQDHRRTIMTCCACGGPRGLYLAWHNALSETRDGVAVNFALSRDSSAATVRSFEPYEGVIEVAMKRAGALDVRVPGKPAPEDVTVERNGKAIRPAWEGSRLRVAGLKKGDAVRVAYPLAERTETVAVGGEFITPVEYRVTWRGNTVIKAEPKGRYCPLYQRESARGPRPAEMPSEGIIPSTEIDW